MLGPSRVQTPRDGEGSARFRSRNCAEGMGEFSRLHETDTPVLSARSQSYLTHQCEIRGQDEALFEKPQEAHRELDWENLSF